MKKKQFKLGMEPSRAVGIIGYDKVLLAEAYRSAERSKSGFAQGREDLEAGAASAAILCSAAATEAWLSEFLAYEQPVVNVENYDVESIRGDRDYLRQWRTLLQCAIRPFDPGSSAEFRALGCLDKLRHQVAHRNARLDVLDTFPLKLSDCVRQKVIPVRRARDVDWTSVIFVHEVAFWSAETSERWIKIVEDLLHPLTRRAVNALDRLGASNEEPGV